MDEGACYICADNDEEPLIFPCPCRGTNAGVHFSCLRDWYATQAEWADLTCKQCKHNFDGSTAVALGEIGLRLVEESEELDDTVLEVMLENIGNAYGRLGDAGRMRDLLERALAI